VELPVMLSACQMLACGENQAYMCFYEAFYHLRFVGTDGGLDACRDAFFSFYSYLFFLEQSSH